MRLNIEIFQLFSSNPNPNLNPNPTPIHHPPSTLPLFPPFPLYPKFSPPLSHLPCTPFHTILTLSSMSPILLMHTYSLSIPTLFNIRDYKSRSMNRNVHPSLPKPFYHTDTPRFCVPLLHDYPLPLP